MNKTSFRNKHSPIFMMGRAEVAHMVNSWNVKETKYADGSMEYMVTDKTFGGPKPPRKKKVRHGFKEFENPVMTPFGLAYGEITDDALFQIYEESQQISDEERLEKAEHSKTESLRRTRKDVEIIGRANLWKYFVTLTFDPVKVNSSDYAEVNQAITKWLNTMKHRYPEMQYLLVFEKHKKGGYHAHALMAQCNLRLIDSGHKVKKTHQTIYNMELKEYNLGFTTVTYVRDSGAASMYLSKYIGKALGEVPKGSKRYWASRNLLREEDVCQKYLFDTTDSMEVFMETIRGLADSVHTIYNEKIKANLTYMKIFAPKNDAIASCPT